MFYARRPEIETAEEKLGWLSTASPSRLSFDEISPDSKCNWLDLSSNDFDSLLPLSDRAGKKRGIFDLATNGVNTARDEWVYEFGQTALLKKMQFAAAEFNEEHAKFRGTRATDLKLDSMSKRIKWSEALLNNVVREPAPAPTVEFLARAQYRPFLALDYYAEPTFSDRLTRNHLALFGTRLAERSPCLAVSAPGKAATFRVLATDQVCDWHFMGDTQLYGQYRFASNSERHDNITDWALKQFQQHYHPGKGRKPAVLNREAIFHYVYAVLHDPVYREKYALNLRRDFPRIPLYGSMLAHFEQWAAWGRELMGLHIGYEAAEPWPVKRTDTPDPKARAAGQAPKCVLKSEPEFGRIVVDSETTLAGIPAAAWAYKLGNRSALDWVLDQHKEKKPKDPTIREKFDTYRFADHKERVIALLARVARVSVETVRIVEDLKAGPR